MIREPSETVRRKFCFCPSQTPELTVPQFHARRNAREKNYLVGLLWIEIWQTLGQKEICCQGNTFQTEIMQSRRRPGAHFSKVPKTFPARKAIPKTPTSLFCKDVFFSYVVKGIKIKITAKFCASRRLRFEDTKSTMSPEMLPKSFGTFEKQAPGVVWNSIKFHSTHVHWGKLIKCIVLYCSRS